jgi:hypothetical protein
MLATTSPIIHGRRGGGFEAINGSLPLSDTSHSPAYTTAAGWNFATALGTIDVYQLVMNSDTSRYPSPRFFRPHQATANFVLRPLHHAAH